MRKIFPKKFPNQTKARRCSASILRGNVAGKRKKPPETDGFVGADDEARTRYLHLGKVALYQMSYIRIWCLRTESNHRHGDFQSPALPTELQRHIMATRIGFEPTTSSVTG